MSPKPQGTSRLFCINQTHHIRAGDTKFREFSSISSLWPGGCSIKSQTVKKGEYAALSPHTERNMKHENKPIRWNVFIPCFVVIGGAALLGIVKSSKLPLRLITLLGLGVSGASFLACLYYLSMKLLHWNAFQAGLGPLLVGLFFLMGLLFFCLGFIGEYIGVIFTHVVRRPLVIEQERLNFDAPMVNTDKDVSPLDGGLQ